MSDVTIFNASLLDEMKTIPQYMIKKALDYIVENTTNNVSDIFITETKRNIPAQKCLFCKGRTVDQIIEESHGEVGPVTAKKYADPSVDILVTKVNDDPMVLGMGAIISFNWDNKYEDCRGDLNDIIEIFEYFGFTVELVRMIEPTNYNVNLKVYMIYGKNPIAIDIQAKNCTFNVKYLIHMLLKHYFNIVMKDEKKCAAFREEDITGPIADILTKDLNYADDSETKEADTEVLINALDLFKAYTGHRNTSKVIMLPLLKELMEFR